MQAKGGTPRIVATGMWGRDREEAETLERLKNRNRPIYRVRARIEKIFGTWKRSYGLRRMRWTGIGKATPQVHLTAIDHNISRALSIVTPPLHDEAAARGAICANLTATIRKIKESSAG